MRHPCSHHLYGCSAAGLAPLLDQFAKRHRQSMEEEVRDTLRNAAREENTPGGGLGTEIASLFKKIGLAGDIPELRGHEIKPVFFD